MTDRNISICVPALTRVEGEGALRLRIKDQRIEEIALDIFEPPRYFEKFLEGRQHHEVIEIVARICGICPVAYQLSAVQALEQIFALDSTAWVNDMRRLFYCGEWLQSHALHVHLLAAPDYLGFENVIDMAAKHPDLVERGLAIQALGNELIRLLGGRSVHPVGARVGGFFHAPALSEIAPLLSRLRNALPNAEALVEWAASLDLPGGPQTFTSLALRHPNEYPMMSGQLVSDSGLDIGKEHFADHVAESHQPHSTALFALLHDEPYLVGPLARLNINHDRLPHSSRALLDRSGIKLPGRDPFLSLFARTLEIHVALVEAIRLLEHYHVPEQSFREPTIGGGIGFGATEAPRGLLWHRYELDERGIVKTARIIPPTSQNQARIADDLSTSLIAFGLDKPEPAVRHHAERVIRNYDPCISCATHFLTLDIQR